MSTPPEPSASAPSSGGRSPGRKAGIVVAVFAATALVAWFAVSVLPRWWSQRVGDQVNGDLTTGAVLGFMYGFFALLLPLAVLGIVYRFWRRSLRAWLIGALIALLLASPNLITLGIALGPGDSAHAADRTLDVEAPYFRGGMIVGVAAGLVIAGAYVWTLSSRRHERRRAEKAEQRLAEERAREPKAPEDGPGSVGP